VWSELPESLDHAARPPAVAQEEGGEHERPNEDEEQNGLNSELGFNRGFKAAPDLGESKEGVHEAEAEHEDIGKEQKRLDLVLEAIGIGLPLAVKAPRHHHDE